MITGALLFLWTSPIWLLVNGVGLVTEHLEIPEFVFTILQDITLGVGYFLPIDVLHPLLMVQIGFYFFRFMWAIVIRVKSFIPTMGA